MKTKSLNKSSWFILCCILIVFVAVFIYQKNSTRQKPVAECVGTGATSLVPLSLEDMLKESPVIITGQIKQENKNDGYTILVNEKLKGLSTFKKGEKIALCTNIVSAREGESYEASLIFIRGFDKDRNSWVTTQGYLGVAPSDKDGVYEVGTKSYTLDEIRRAIKAQK